MLMEKALFGGSGGKGQEKPFAIYFFSKKPRYLF